MNSTDPSLFGNKVLQGAKSFGIIPKLFLIAIGGLAENENVTDERIFQTYYRHLMPDMLLSAESQLKSDNSNLRTAGEFALLKASDKTIEGLMFYDVNKEIGEFTDYNMKGIEILNLHTCSFETILKERNKNFKKNMANKQDNIL